ncbi:MAG: PEP-CTERM sorting domain-containing protein [Nitrospirota bacterium]
MKKFLAKWLKRKKVALPVSAFLLLLSFSLLAQVAPAISNSFAPKPAVIIEYTPLQGLVVHSGASEFTGWAGGGSPETLALDDKSIRAAAGSVGDIDAGVLADASGLYSSPAREYVPGFGSYAVGDIPAAAAVAGSLSGVGSSISLASDPVIAIIPRDPRGNDPGNTAIPTPEPSPFIMLGAGLAGMTLVMRRFRRT